MIIIQGNLKTETCNNDTDMQHNINISEVMLNN